MKQSQASKQYKQSYQAETPPTLKNLKRKQRSGWLQNVARNLVLTRLQSLAIGKLTIVEDEQRHEFGKDGALNVTINVHDAHFYGEIAFGGSIGAGEAYMLGYWTTNNMTDLIRQMMINQQVMNTLEGGLE